MKRTLFMSMAAMAMIAALVGGATFAIFTDSAENVGNTFTAGTVDIASADVSVDTGIGNMAPGDTKTETINVENKGTLELRYDIAEVKTGDLFKCQEENTTPGDCDGGPATVAYQISRDNGSTWSAITPGDNNLVLAPAGKDLLQISITLPKAAENAYQKDSGYVTLTFNAEQTANNP